MEFATFVQSQQCCYSPVARLPLAWPQRTERGNDRFCGMFFTIESGQWPYSYCPQAQALTLIWSLQTLATGVFPPGAQGSCIGPASSLWGWIGRWSGPGVSGPGQGWRRRAETPHLAPPGGTPPPPSRRRPTAPARPDPTGPTGCPLGGSPGGGGGPLVVVWGVRLVDPNLAWVACKGGMDA
jgi:hypothetical protein